MTDVNGNPTTNSELGTTGYPAKTTDALGNTTSYTYDERGQVTQATDALGKSTSRTYDKDSLPVATKDAEGNEALISYDEREVWENFVGGVTHVYGGADGDMIPAARGRVGA
ncbi:RHS repeat protein [Streptomyces sp. NBC_00250]|uniref:RHS repeat domain-containing protein n=1 Tax=Streptomyces sp. NBC_00250 TaxID=2903641 RepID=UPI002E293457|nr:RHS repeat domain-containing protein [Streptomyces sp. NBC_00250]